LVSTKINTYVCLLIFLQTQYKSKVIIRKILLTRIGTQDVCTTTKGTVETRFSSLHNVVIYKWVYNWANSGFN